MRILSLSNCPLNEAQGSGYVICGYARELRRRGHEVDLFGPETMEIWPRLEGTLRRYRLTLGIFATALRQVSRHAYDVIELYGAETFLAALLLPHLRGRARLVVHHSCGLEPYMSRDLALVAAPHITDPPVSWQDRLCIAGYLSCDGLITVSERDRAFAIARQFQHEPRVIAIENPLPDSYLRRPLQLERGKVLAFVGSWLDRKGSRIIPEAIGRILREHPDWRAVLVGVDEATVVPDFAVDIRPRIQIVPHVSDKQALAEIYASARILVMPSFYESFGLVATEGLANGCALVATKTGFAAGLAAGREAILIEQPAVDALYAGIQRLVTDDDLRRSIAAAGYQRVQALSWETAGAALEATYATWLAEQEATCGVARGITA